MVDYYKIQHTAFLKLNSMIKQRGSELSYNKLLYDLTLEFPISEKAIAKRIDKLQLMGIIKRYDDTIEVL